MGDIKKQKNKFLSISFTMAEILLSLTIIGVVAAITLPSLTGNINEKTWNAQRKALYARLSQSIALIGSLNNYGEYVGIWSTGSISTITDTAAKAFVTDGLAKVLKMNNICDNEHFKDCGVPDKIKRYVNDNMPFPKTLYDLNTTFASAFVFNNATYQNPLPVNTKAMAFETHNKESVVLFYNPRCVASEVVQDYVQPTMCANFVYDLNGRKGPNAIGRDIGFITAFYPTDTVVVNVVPCKNRVASQMSSIKWSNAKSACKTMHGEEARVPNKEEMSALYVNKIFFNIATGGFWTSKLETSSTAYALNFGAGQLRAFATNLSGSVLCVE